MSKCYTMTSVKIPEIDKSKIKEKEDFIEKELSNLSDAMKLEVGYRVSYGESYMNESGGNVLPYGYYDYIIDIIKAIKNKEDIWIPHSYDMYLVLADVYINGPSEKRLVQESYNTLVKYIAETYPESLKILCTKREIK